MDVAMSGTIGTKASENQLTPKRHASVSSTASSLVSVNDEKRRRFLLPLRSALAGPFLIGAFMASLVSLTLFAVGWGGSINRLSDAAKSGALSQAENYRTLTVGRAKVELSAEISAPVTAVELATRYLLIDGYTAMQTQNVLENSTATYFNNILIPLIRQFSSINGLCFGIWNDAGRHLYCDMFKNKSLLMNTIWDENLRSNAYQGFAYDMSSWSPTSSMLFSFPNFTAIGRKWWSGIMETSSANESASVVYDSPTKSLKWYYSVRMPEQLVSSKIKTGMVLTALTLEFLDDYFKSFPITENGVAFLFETSEKIILATTGSNTTQNGTLWTVTNHPDPRVAKYILQWNSTYGEAEASYKTDNGETFIDVVYIDISEHTGWWLLMALPVKDFTSTSLSATHSEVLRSRKFMYCVAIGTAILVLGMSIGVFLITSLVVEQIRVITNHIASLAKMEFSALPVFRTAVVELWDIMGQTRRMTVALETFTVYVPRNVVHWLIKSNEAPTLGMKQKIATVFFLDIANFTATMEERGTASTLEILQTMFEEFSVILIQHGAIIDKYIGDAIMAVWNVPESKKNHPDLACDAALCIIEALERLNVGFNEELGITMSIRIGITTGAVYAGNIGCHSRMNYTVIGDTVNMAARLEPMNKELGTMVCVSDSMRRACSGESVFRCIGWVPLKGFKGNIRVHELVGRKSRLTPDTLHKLSLYAAIDDDLMAGVEDPPGLPEYLENIPDDPSPAAAVRLRVANANS